MRGDFRRGTGVNACKTLVGPQNTRSATRRIVASRFELPLLGSNQDSPDPESGVLPVTPRGKQLQSPLEAKGANGLSRLRPSLSVRPSDRPTVRPSRAEGARTPDHLGAIQELSQLSYTPVGLNTKLSARPATTVHLLV